MLNCKELEFSLMGVSMAASQISMSRHGNRSCCNSAIQCPICPSLHTFDKNPGLNTSKYESAINGGSAPGDNLYSPDCQLSLEHIDEPQRQISSENLVT